MQVTCSKRRNGLFKKANELTVLCDAKVSIIMLSSTGKLHEYISPSVATKQLFDQYQKTLGIDLWSSHYEKMQEHLKKLKHVNRNLQREIRQWMGDSLNELSYEDLHDLELDMETFLKIIRDRKYVGGVKRPAEKLSVFVSLTRSGLPRIIPAHHRKIIARRDARSDQVTQWYLSWFTLSILVCLAPKDKVISNQIETYKKKNSDVCMNVEEIHRSLLHEFDAIGEDPHYGLVDNEGDYDSVLAYSNGDCGILALRLQPNHHNLHAGA